MRRHTTVTRLAAAALTALVVAACSGGPAGDPAFAATLEAFDGCEQLRDYFVEHAVDMVGPYGLHGGGHHGRGMLERGGDDVAEDSVAAEPVPEAAPGGGDESARAAAPVAGEDYSATNVQEAGVDEPDLVKTDGQRLVTVSGGRLHVLDVSGDEPTKTGALDLPEEGGSELLLAGDRALVLGMGGGHVDPMPSRPAPGPGGPGGPDGPTSTVTLVDLAGQPEVIETLTVDGGYVSARLVDGVARVALRTHPVGLDFTSPEGSGLRAEREATQRNRAIVEASEIDNWLPYFVREAPDGGSDEGLLLDCADVHHPEEFGGLGLAAVFSLDPAAGLDPSGSAAVVGAGETVYATPANLYVTTQRWADMAPERDGGRPARDVTTDIHRFAIDDPSAPAYEASGEVPGYLLDQWALSEHDGHLRVATTEDRAGGEAVEPGDGPDASASSVHVLDADLEEVGVVDGLGVGERIYAVRYAGEIGYVVTFRQIDPLYTIDLSDPTEPRVLGELKITGYSGYLHPLGDDRLLGVGQEATEDGRTQGAQLSVFDVADLADPRVIDQLMLPGAHTAVEHDHRALLHWQPEDLLVLPVEQHPRPVPEPAPEEPAEEPPEEPAEPSEAPEEPSEPADPGVPPQPPDRDTPFIGALVVRIDGDQLVEVGRVEHPGDDWGPPVQRALVVGDVLYTVGPNGVLASDLASLEQIAWIGL